MIPLDATLTGYDDVPIANPVVLGIRVRLDSVSLYDPLVSAATVGDIVPHFAE